MIGSVVLAALTLAGCETGPTRQQVLASLVGRPESDALRVLGAPNRILEANGHKFLAYQDSGVGYVGTPPIGPFVYGYYTPLAFPVVRTCETTIEVTGAGSRRGRCGATLAAEPEPRPQPGVEAGPSRSIAVTITSRAIAALFIVLAVAARSKAASSTGTVPSTDVNPITGSRGGSGAR